MKCVIFCILLVFLLCGVVFPATHGGQVTNKSSPKPNPNPKDVSVPSASSSGNKKLYWSSNHAGMFSQLLQTKLMYDYAQRYQRSLVLDTFSSYHYGANISIETCSFFNFKSPNIRCDGVPDSVKCSDKLSVSMMESNQEDLCYNGVFLYNLNGARSMREGVVAATTLDLAYSIQESRLTAFADFLKDLLSTSPSGPFTVVHWRRGDQLVKRCENGIDTSVNCESAASLIRKVQQKSQDKIVYVATNEPQDSSEMDVLRKAGYKTLSNVVSMSSSGNGSSSNSGTAAAQQRQQRYNALDTLSVLAVEYSLMVRADTYLAWGISEIDDVVEYERMKLGKTHCTAYEPFTPVHGNVTFCLNLKQPDSIRVKPLSKTGHTKPTIESAKAVATQAEQKISAVENKAVKAVRDSATVEAKAPVIGERFRNEATIKANKQRMPPTATATDVVVKPDQETGAGAPPVVVPSDEAAVTAPTDSSDHRSNTKMAALIQQPQDGFILTKTAFSSQSRLLFVAGLEGTGHHAIKAMFSVCAKKGLCEPDHIIAQACQQFNAKTRTVTGLFSGAGKNEMADVATIEARMKVLAEMKGNHLFLVGLSFTAGAGMLSYPNFDGKHKAMDYPDVSTLAMIAESVGLDFRVLVLQRSAEEIMSSTLKRGFGGVLGIEGEPKILIESANALYSQLSLLDKKFYQCIQYKQLGKLNEKEKASLVNFLHPGNLEGQFNAMLKEVSYNSSTKHTNRPENKETLDPLNAKYQTMHLANRLALIDGLCRQQ